MNYLYFLCWLSWRVSGSTVRVGSEFEVRLIETGGVSAVIGSILPISCILSAIKMHAFRPGMESPSGRIVIYVSIGRLFSVHRLPRGKCVSISFDKEMILREGEALFQFASEVMYSIMLFHFDGGSPRGADDDIRSEVNRILEVDLAEDLLDCLDGMVLEKPEARRTGDGISG